MRGSERQEVSGGGEGPSTVVLLLELIAFYFSTLLRLSGLLSAEGGVLGFTLNIPPILPGPRAVFQIA